MHFGDRDEMLALAQKRLAELKPKRPHATLVDAREVRVIFLAEHDPKLYHAYLKAEM
jgi:formate dehydrogenase iron-sulfur subunit